MPLLTVPPGSQWQLVSRSRMDGGAESKEGKNTYSYKTNHMGFSERERINLLVHEDEPRHQKMLKPGFWIDGWMDREWVIWYVSHTASMCEKVCRFVKYLWASRSDIQSMTLSNTPVYMTFLNKFMHFAYKMLKKIIQADEIDFFWDITELE